MKRVLTSGEVSGAKLQATEHSSSESDHTEESSAVNQASQELNTLRIEENGIRN